MHRLLLVEDEDALRNAYTLILSTESYLVDAAKNGLEALELCDKYAYDLILLDIMMPVMDGVGFLRSYLEYSQAQESKIIVLTNLSAGKELAEIHKMGVCKSILKADMTPRQLLESVRYELASS